MVTCLTVPVSYQVSYPLRKNNCSFRYLGGSPHYFSASHFVDPKAKTTMKGLFVFRCLMCFITGDTQPQVLSRFSPFLACCSRSKYSPSEKPLIFTPTGQPALCLVSATKRGGELDFNFDLNIRSGFCRSASVLTHTSPRQLSASPGDWVGNLAVMH